MTRVISKVCSGYYLPITIPVFTVLFAVSAATAARLAGIELEAAGGGTEYVRSVTHSDRTDIVHDLRVGFAANHGVADPAALVAAVRHSSMAHLLISVAIEESRGDPVAVGAAGERGAWQVKPADWGHVPIDLHGQANQAESIIRRLLIDTKGNRKQALARYNGGTTPPGKSYRYAERILKRAGHLQVAVNFLPPNYFELREALFDPSGISRLL